MSLVLTGAAERRRDRAQESEWREIGAIAPFRCVGRLARNAAPRLLQRSNQGGGSSCEQHPKKLTDLKGSRAQAGVESTICTRDFAAAVDAAGGRALLEDMMRYQVEWNELLSGQFQGYKIMLSPTTFGAKIWLT